MEPPSDAPDERRRDRLRSFKTTTRGLHPSFLLLDDLLDEQTTATKSQRDRAWTYFVGTLIPMHAQQLIVIGTALHRDDLLHRLRPKEPQEGIAEARGRPVTPLPFRWERFQAINPDGTCLWPDRHGYDELMSIQNLDPILFSREYQNEPLDDAASLFPRDLTDTLKVEGATFLPFYRRGPDEAVILGQDIALSEAAGADYTVQIVVVWNRITQRRRVIFARRARGLDFRQQVTRLREVMSLYQVDMAVVEENGFQKWLFREAQRWPETAGKVVGHRTGQERADLDEGIPALKLAFLGGLWELPVRDRECADFFNIWQAEHAAFAYKDGRLRGVGEHDDTVLATWMVECGIRLLQEWLRRVQREEIVTAEDLGFQRTRINPELDALDAQLGFESPHDAWMRRHRDDLE